VTVIPDIEDNMTTFPGSGYPAFDLAALNRGRKAKAVKKYEEVLMV